MKTHHPISIKIGKIFFTVVRLLLGCRYKVEIKGAEILKTKTPKLLLPNHQAIADPMILLSHLYKYTTAVPVVTSSFYDMPIAKYMFSSWGAVRVSDLEAGSRNTNVLNQITNAVIAGFHMNKNIVIYPAGQISGQGYEKIFNKQGTKKIVEQLPENVSVIGVRINGLWGSMWSKAWTGKSPKFIPTFLKGIFYLLANFFILLPKRKITIEFKDLTEDALKNASLERQEFNNFLEAFYNINGAEEVNYLKHYFFVPKLIKRLPAQISGSVNESKGQEKASIEVPEEIKRTITKIVAQTLEIATDKISDNSNLALDLGGDSLNLVEIVSSIEEKYLNCSTPAISDIKTITDLYHMAMGISQSETQLKPSFLNEKLPIVQPINVNREQNILEQFISSFTSETQLHFSFDANSGSITRKEFMLKACVVAQLIKNEVKDTYVGIMLPALQTTTLLIAATYIAGKVPVMLNWTVGKKVLSHCIETAGVNKILSVGSFIDKIKDQLPDSISNNIILLEQKANQLSKFTKLKGLIVSKYPKTLISTKTNNPAVILFTSGSENLPKAVPLTHKNITSDLNSVFNTVPIQNDQVFLGFLPPFHSFGFTVLSILPLLTGIRVAYTPDPTDAKEVVKMIRHTHANLILGTPSFLKLILANASRIDLHTIKLAISGAEAMPQAISDQFAHLVPDGEILEGYGITECSPVLTINPPKKTKSNSVGVFLDKIHAQIIDLDTNKPLTNNKEGMICVKGDNIFHGYLKFASDPFININNQKYYKTGDLGYLDDEGYLFITGRLKRFIKIAGEMISLPFIEKILLEKYQNDDQQVLAIEGSDKNNPPIITLFSTLELKLEDVNQYLLSKGVAPISKIRTIHQLNEIPLLGTGKIDYKQLKGIIENN